MNYIAESFEKDLQNSILATRNKNKRLPSKKYKPSGLKCIRALYYMMTDTPLDEDTSPYFMTGITESGTDTHCRIQNAVSAMRENGFDCDYLDVGEFVRSQQEKGLCQDIVIGEIQGNETHLYNTKYNISFLCDGIIKYKGEYYIIEFKTEGTKKWQVRKDVNPDHINQAATYSMCLGLDNVLFVYINRDYSAFKAYMLPVTDTMRERVISKIEECERYLAREVVPPKPTDAKSDLCQYCAYKTTCKAQEEKDKEAQLNLPPLPF